MNLEDLSYICEDCASWYEKKQCKSTLHGISKSGCAIEKFWCPCGGEVNDCAEVHAVKPYDQMKLEMLADQVNAYHELISQIHRRMTDIDGERR
jgi:hypothetical protein